MFDYRKFLLRRIKPRVVDTVALPFPMSDWSRFERFLILGSENGRYVARERALNAEHIPSVLRSLEVGGVHAVSTIEEKSLTSRAPSNAPAVFALALAAVHGNAAVKRAAIAALPRVCRTTEHLFQFAEAAQSLRGFDPTVKRAVALWYAEQRTDDLARQVVTSRQRGGWTHRDLIRLSQPLAADPARKALYEWVATERASPALPSVVKGYVALQHAKTADEAAALIAAHDLPIETVPKHWRRDEKVLRAVVERMPVKTLLRELGRLTATGVLKSTGEGLNLIMPSLRDITRVWQSHLHPFAFLLALDDYRKGHDNAEKLNWEPLPQVEDALEAAFHAAFANSDTTGKRLLIAVDGSYSMGASHVVGTGLSARDAVAAMALVSASVERECHVAAFTVPSGLDEQRLLPVNIDATMRLPEALREIANYASDSVDCALPMLYALENDLKVDAFVVYTDSEVRVKSVHPALALREYRSRSGIPAKLVIAGVASAGFAIADTNDGGMLDIIGFSESTPRLIADFIRN
ncbi:TROVE domain-containing protein [Rhodomicrobium sp.]|uniref:TROVE domain-containing protein n=1 Tax=Rhodomicrobium sp. TaxID=2720632 RepID=UPI0039E69E78